MRPLPVIAGILLATFAGCSDPPAALPPASPADDAALGADLQAAVPDGYEAWASRTTLYQDIELSHMQFVSYGFGSNVGDQVQACIIPRDQLDVWSAGGSVDTWACADIADEGAGGAFLDAGSYALIFFCANEAVECIVTFEIEVSEPVAGEQPAPPEETAAPESDAPPEPAGTPASAPAPDSMPPEASSPPLISPSSGWTRTNTVDKPVLLIHGFNMFGGGSSAGGGENIAAQWDNWIASMKSLGWTGEFVTVGYYEDDVEANLNLGSFNADGPPGGVPNAGHDTDTPIEHLANHLAWAIHDRYFANGICVDIVAHSMGGLITRYAIMAVETKAKGFPTDLCIEDVVTMGTPHQGYLASGLNPDYQPQQMTPGSAFLAEINRVEKLPQVSPGTDWTLVGSENDGVVSAESATAYGSERLVYLDEAGVCHTSIACHGVEDIASYYDMLPGESEMLDVRSAGLMVADGPSTPSLALHALKHDAPMVGVGAVDLAGSSRSDTYWAQILYRSLYAVVPAGELTPFNFLVAMAGSVEFALGGLGSDLVTVQALAQGHVGAPYATPAGDDAIYGDFDAQSGAGRLEVTCENVWDDCEFYLYVVRASDAE